MATERVEVYQDGVLVETSEVPITDAEANQRAMWQAARNALTANRTFLAIATPTNAQTLAQVKALTRQMDALIRLQLNHLDGTD